MIRQEKPGVGVLFWLGGGSIFLYEDGLVPLPSSQREHLCLGDS